MGAQPPAERREQLVAHGMAPGVVDLLEVVEVEEHDGQLGPRAAGSLERDPEPIEEQGTIGEAGQLVVERQVGEFGLRALTLDRVDERAAEQRRRQAALGQGILGAGLNCAHGQRLVLGVGQDHDRRVGSGQPDVLEQIQRVHLPVGRDVEQHAARRMVDEGLRSRRVPLGMRRHVHTTPNRVQLLVDQPRGAEIAGQKQDPYRPCMHRIAQQ